MAQKNDIIQDIIAKLGELHLAYRRDEGTDIAISSEFLDAGWGSGNKKINYDALIFANDQDSTVYMFELTKETGSGFSFGGDSESSFQSGKTLFRKVKSVQYGLDGKAYEFSLDLGAIPKAVKESAVAYGWHFKTVLKREKAMWPGGYTAAAVQQPINPAAGFCANCGNGIAAGAGFCAVCGTPVGKAATAPLMAQPAPAPSPRDPFADKGAPLYAKGKAKSGSKSAAIGFIGLMCLSVLMAVLLLGGGSGMGAWLGTIAVVVLFYALQRKLKHKGCLIHGLLLLIAGSLLFVIFAMNIGEEVSFTTANIKNAHMTTGIDEGRKPVDTVTAYLTDAPELIASAELRNAPSNTSVRFVWTYVTEDVRIAEFPMNSGDSGTDVYVSSNLTNDRPWPVGTYKVDIFIEDRETPDATIEFVVE